MNIKNTSGDNAGPAITRYSQVTIRRGGEEWSEMRADTHGEWMEAEDVLAAMSRPVTLSPEARETIREALEAHEPLTGFFPGCMSEDEAMAVLNATTTPTTPRPDGVPCSRELAILNVLMQHSQSKSPAFVAWAVDRALRLTEDTTPTNANAGRLKTKREYLTTKETKP